MLGAILRRLRKRSEDERRYSVPDGLRVYAIGDVHGCLDELERVLEKIDNDLAGRDVRSHMVFLGDLVDRGPNSAGVIERVLHQALPTHDASVLMGNHEEIMLKCYDGDTESYAHWLQFGGLETIESYGITRRDLFDRSYDLARAMRAMIPSTHIDFIRSFKDHVTIGDYLFVHAGIRPGRSLNEQTTRDLRWIRSGFLESKEDHGFMVVHGHTIIQTAERHRNRIAVDTGCYLTGRLSAVAIEGNHVDVLTVSS